MRSATSSSVGQEAARSQPGVGLEFRRSPSRWRSPSRLRLRLSLRLSLRWRSPSRRRASVRRGSFRRRRSSSRGSSSRRRLSFSRARSSGSSSRASKGESKVFKKLIKPLEEVGRVNAELEKKEKEFEFTKAGWREERLNFNLVSVRF